MAKLTDLKPLVDATLDASLKNGYDPRDEDTYKVCEDLLDLDANIADVMFREGRDVQELAPLVDAWRLANATKELDKALAEAGEVGRAAIVEANGDAAHDVTIAARGFDDVVHTEPHGDGKKPPVYVAGYSTESELEAEQDDPSVGEMDLVDYAWPRVAAASQSFDDVLATAKAACERELMSDYEGEDGDGWTQWSPPFVSKTGTDGAGNHWRCLGTFSFRYRNAGDKATNKEKCVIVVRAF